MEVETVADERLEMERHFQKHALDADATDTREPQTASIVDYSVTKEGGFYDAISVNIYVFTGDEYVVHSFDHRKNAPSETLWEFLEDTHTTSLADLFGVDLYIVPQEDESWHNQKYDIEFNTAILPSDSTNRRHTDAQLFSAKDEVYRTAKQKRENAVKKGLATIIDYDVRQSAPEITQELEIDLKFRLPNGKTKWYKCIHDKDCPDEAFERIRKLNDNPEKVYELVGTNLPVKWDEEHLRWVMFITNPITSGLAKWLAKVGLVSQFRGPTYAISKNYSHADGR